MYIAHLKANKSILNLPRLAENYTITNPIIYSLLSFQKCMLSIVILSFREINTYK